MDMESGTKVKDNGKCDAENSDTKITNTTEVEVDGTIGKTGILPVGSLGLSPSPTTKGRGLRKWRRIHRQSGMETNYNFDSNRKRGMPVLPVGMKHSEGSSSSTNAMSNVLDHISGYGDLSSRKGPDFSSRADSENSEDQNSRSSTAASASRGNHEFPVVDLGFNLIGKNAGVLVQPGDQQEKGQNLTKKPRGVQIIKENSISSMDSDSRSSNFVFLQAANSMRSNGRSNGRSGNYDADESDDDRNGDILNHVAKTPFSKNGADNENVSLEEALAGENSWEVKEEKTDDDHLGSGDLDPLVDTIIPLQLAQEALKREVQKLKDVGKEDMLSTDDWAQPPLESNEAHLVSKLEKAFNMLELKNIKISELESTLNSTKIINEYEELLTRRIAAEVEYLVISKTIQNLKADQTHLTTEQKNVSVTATAPELEDAKKMKNRVRRYVICSIIQSVLLLVVLYIFVLKFSSKIVEVIPT
ncbi:hypothetical protein R6Q59_018649 [Mikania micrantha]|uniref:WPP domain-containing protein n=1 Tax=Mikania micrantha TaxID=192012 RepID=A0A5N6M0M5_9ASTR|nr:hypothetical protein E3N88_35151 [Mikania micrantha]